MSKPRGVSLSVTFLLNFEHLLKGNRMFKLIWRLVVFAIIVLIAFIVLSIYSGGEKFRWLGKEVEHESRKIGEKADEIKKKSDKVIKGIKTTKEKVEDPTGRKHEPSH